MLLVLKGQLLIWHRRIRHYHQEPDSLVRLLVSQGAGKFVRIMELYERSRFAKGNAESRFIIKEKE